MEIKYSQIQLSREIQKIEVKNGLQLRDAHEHLSLDYSTEKFTQFALARIQIPAWGRLGLT